MDSSLFNRSSRILRSPPPTQHSAAMETALPPPAARTSSTVVTPGVQKWLTDIEQCLTDICSTANEGKLNTDQKLRISNISRNVMHGISQLAVEYQDLKQKYISLTTKISTERTMQNYFIELKEAVQSAPKANRVQPTETSFADMVKRQNNTFVKPSPASSIAIYPNSKDTSSEDTKKLIQQIIRPDELKLQVRGLRKTKNGGVIISTETRDDLRKLTQSKVLQSSGLKIEEPSKRNPRIVIVGVPNSLNEKDVFEFLFEQNIADKHPSMTHEEFKNTVKLSHKSGRKESSAANYIIEVPPNIRRTLINQERIYINWTSCPVRDFTLVTRCFKCQQYGHAAKYCRDSDSTCGHCAKSGHSIKECPKNNEPAICATCHRFKKPCAHNTGDEKCPARINAETRYVNSVNYEGA